MRLLNTRTIQVEEFLGPDVPRYSILSHRWEDEEVTLRDLNNGHYKTMIGYQKILGCCRISRIEGFGYTWIDSCCIDKSSSAELSEAINSMFNWYKHAAVCYAYLSDVAVPSDLANSKWFERGWTLQELIAPGVVVFLDASWREIGTRASLAHAISAASEIDEELLSTLRPTEDITSILRGRYSVATRMSWAARRTTTRLEDQAYCLMGLFDVNMPLLYGEGSKAFRRLQQEIMNDSDDDSIFAWHYPNGCRHGQFSGLLADSPLCFTGLNTAFYVRPRPSQFSPSSMNKSRHGVRLRLRHLGDLQTLLNSSDGLLARIRRVLNPDESLLQVLQNEYREDHKALEARVVALKCTTYQGNNIVLLLANSEANSGSVLSRYLFDRHLYSVSQFSTRPSYRDFNILLRLDLNMNDEDRLPSVRFAMPSKMLGYKLWATSSRLQRDGGSAYISKIKDGTGCGWVLFENPRDQKWPPFLVAYQHSPGDNHFKISCSRVAEDFMPTDIANALGELVYWSTRSTSRVSMQLQEHTRLVIKLRVRVSSCEMIFLVASSRASQLNSIATGDYSD